MTKTASGYATYCTLRVMVPDCTNVPDDPFTVTLNVPAGVVPLELTPVPVSATVCGLFPPLSVMVSVPVRDPDPAIDHARIDLREEEVHGSL